MREVRVWDGWERGGTDLEGQLAGEDGVGSCGVREGVREGGMGSEWDYLLFTRLSRNAIVVC